MQLRTLQFRIKDSTSATSLTRMGWRVNYVWNFCNETAAEQWSGSRKFLSGFDLNQLTAGCSKELGLHSQTVQAVCEEHHKSCKQHRRSKLSWRSEKIIRVDPFQGFRHQGDGRYDHLLWPCV